MTIGFDTNILLAYYQARAGIPSAAASAAAASNPNAAKTPVAPSAPWATANASATAATTSKDVKDAMLGRRFVDESAAQLDVKGASDDYRKLFALYQGLSTLSGVVDGLNAKGATAGDKARIQATFNRGLAEISDYTDGLNLDSLRLTRGDAMDKDQMSIGVPKIKPSYVTAPLVSGDVSAPVDAFAGNVQFNISVKRIGVVHDVPIDLTNMAGPRTLSNVVTYINDQLSAQGLATRVATQKTVGTPKTVSVNGKDVTVGTNPDTWSMKINVDSGETVSFSAPQTAGAVYVAQSAGDPNPDKDPTTNDAVIQNQLLKFQTDTTNLATPPQVSTEANWVDGRVWSETLDKNVQTVRATTTGPDGSVYMLADVDGTTNGQAIKGATDVALMKYDSAGNLVYTRTLGASADATGLALAVSADGKIAVAGSVTGGLSGATNGPLNSGDTGSFAASSDSFVTLYDADGQEVWTQRRGARSDDQATNVAFGDDGSVYVAGRAKSTMPGASAIGNWDSYVEGFKADAKGKVATLFTQTVGTAGTDKSAGLVVDGTSLVLAANEDGHGVLRRFDMSGGGLTQTAVRDIGDLQGGDITGLGIDGGNVVIAGTTRNGALSAGTITNNIAGGTDAFAARLSADLSASGSDRLAYYGGTGDDKATALAVSGGQVWIAGSVGTDLPNQAPVGKKDGFVTQLNLDTGNADWSRRITGKDGYAAPTSMAVDTQGASILDRLGLPKGALDMTDSVQLASMSSVRPGDTFQVRAGENGVLKTVTIDPNETLDTLTTKLNRALSFQAKVSVVTVQGTKRLQIQPLNNRSTLEFFAGKTGHDALSSLGLSEGVVRATTVDKNGKTVPGDGKGMIYGLDLPSTLNLNDKDQIAHTISQLAAAMGVVRTAYKDMSTPASSAATKNPGKTGGTVPAYMTNQIANYQAALDRLTGGG